MGSPPTSSSTQPHRSASPGRPSAGKKIALAIYAVVAIISIGAATIFSFTSASQAGDLRARLTMIAPAGAGGGWDSFVREQQQAMRLAGVSRNAQVVNIPGAGGTIGLGRFSTMHGEASTIIATGSAMVGGIELNNSPVGFDDVTLLARMAEDYDVVIAPVDAPYDDVPGLLEAWQEDPGGFRWTGGSAGSMDHQVVARLAQEAGIEGTDITYIPKSGGGEAIQTLLSGTTDVAATGYNEVSDQIEAGRVKALGLTSPEPLNGVDIEPMSEQGVDIVMGNWRGMLGAPGITDEEKAELIAMLEETRDSAEWQDALKRNSWVDAWMTGEEFEDFLVEDQKNTAELLEVLGL
ncbi:Bug family tripartite tricarboxylate transporter substrate binding protein [Brevibacterium otitidis]|uniref:Bug family tripartite tricarboxylate transporter substrate binding protein n=1 Tax=Brevibacterium otitidis TaxID=53364 RepID=A0ABV5X2W0_9MICO|nr:tripartite tricarboxylate transporter substrate binding protein TctC [Brevibacterium otitidis]